MTISEISRQYGLTADTLRYYEKIGLLPRITRKSNGVRDYQPQDCRMIEFIKCMRSAGMPVEALVRYFALMKEGDKTDSIRRQMLVEQREVLLGKKQEIEETLKRLEYKISLYDRKLREEKTHGEEKESRTESGLGEEKKTGAESSSRAERKSEKEMKPGAGEKMGVRESLSSLKQSEIPGKDAQNL